MAATFDIISAVIAAAVTVIVIKFRAHKSKCITYVLPQCQFRAWVLRERGGAAVVAAVPQRALARPVKRLSLINFKMHRSSKI